MTPRTSSTVLWTLVIVLALGFIFAVTMALSPSVTTMLLAGASLIAVIDLLTARSNRGF